MGRGSGQGFLQQEIINNPSLTMIEVSQNYQCYRIF
jgi:hypothetical protein